jgi:hypothetical protein
LLACCSYFVNPAKAASVTLLHSNGFTTISGAYRIQGEFQNQENTPIMCDHFTITYYDKNNNVLTIQNYSSSFLDIILPNQKSPFSILLTSPEVENLSAAIDHYSLEMSCKPTTLKPLDLRIVSSTADIDDPENIRFTGEVENAGTDTANVTTVLVTCYDANGNFICADWDLANPTTIPPGQKASFEIRGVYYDQNLPQTANYTLIASSYIYEYSTGLDIGTEEFVFPPYVNTAWTPPPQNVVESTVVSTAAIGVVAVAIAAGTRSAGATAGKAAEKAQSLASDSVKKWLEELMCSKKPDGTCTKAEKSTRSPFLPTKMEAVAYGVSLVVLSISFSYAKVLDFALIWQVLPLILLTAVIVEVLKTYLLEVYARRRGVWTEHKLWYFGLVLFLVTTFAFGVPFSSPSRNVYRSEKLDKRLSGMIGTASILITLAFAGVFFGITLAGFALVGSTGLAMCIIIALIDTFPMTPMNGKSVFDHSKALWAALFIIAALSYVAWLLLL